MNTKQKLILRIAKYESMGRYDWANETRQVLNNLENENTTRMEQGDIRKFKPTSRSGKNQRANRRTI